MLTSLLIFVPTCLFFAMLPGPDFALILKTSLINGKKASFWAAIGIAAGLCVHTSLSVIGLTAIIAHSPAAFTLIRYAGAAYLAYIGISGILATLKKAKQSESLTADIELEAKLVQQQSVRKAFRQGFITNVLNPKAVLFFVTFLPQFLSTSSSISSSMQLLILGITMCVITGSWFVVLGFLLERIRRYFENGHFRRWLERITGAIFIGFGVRLALE